MTFMEWMVLGSLACVWMYKNMKQPHDMAEEK